MKRKSTPPGDGAGTRTPPRPEPTLSPSSCYITLEGPGIPSLLEKLKLALPASSSTRHRLSVVTALMMAGPGTYSRAYHMLGEALKHEDDPGVVSSLKGILSAWTPPSDRP